MRRFIATCITLAALVPVGCALRAPINRSTVVAEPLSWTCESDDKCTVERIGQDGLRHPLLTGAPFPFSRPRRRAGDLLETRTSCGSPPRCFVTFFADTRTQQVSFPFVNTIATDARRRLVAVVNQRSIRVMRIFGQGQAFEITRDFAPVDQLTDAIVRSEFVDGPALKLTYLNSQFKRHTDAIRIEVAILPPVPIPPAPVGAEVFRPLSRLTKRNVERQLQRVQLLGAPGHGLYRLTEGTDIKVTNLFTNPDGTVTANYRAIERPTEIGLAVGRTEADARVFIGAIVYRRYEDGWRYESGRLELADDVRQRLQAKP